MCTLRAGTRASPREHPVSALRLTWSTSTSAWLSATTSEHQPGLQAQPQPRCRARQGAPATEASLPTCTLHALACMQHESCYSQCSVAAKMAHRRPTWPCNPSNCSKAPNLPPPLRARHAASLRRRRAPDVPAQLRLLPCHLRLLCADHTTMACSLPAASSAALACWADSRRPAVAAACPASAARWQAATAPVRCSRRRDTARCLISVMRQSEPQTCHCEQEAPG